MSTELKDCSIVSREYPVGDPQKDAQVYDALSEESYQRFLDDRFDVTKDPQGLICLAYAENKLLWSVLVPRLNEVIAKLEPEELFYEYSHGSHALRHSIAKYLQRFSATKMEPDNLVMTAGSATACEMLLYVLTQPGDAVIVPAPYVDDFPKVVSYRNGLRLIAAPTHDASGIPTCTDKEVVLTALENAYQRAKQGLGAKLVKNDATCRGVARPKDLPSGSPRAVLLNNPNNPTCQSYPAEVMEAIVNFCQERELHLVVDEVFSPHALQYFPSGSVPRKAQQHRCVYEYVPKKFFRFVHLVNGLGKFGLGGLKVGVLHTFNETVLKGTHNLSNFSQISSHTQAAVAEMLADDDFVDELLAFNTNEISRSYNTAVAALEKMEVPYVPSDAGVCILLDLRGCLDPKAKKSLLVQEQDLYHELVENAKVILAPGTRFGAEPGFFRLCFTEVPRLQLRAAIERIGQFLIEHRHKGRAGSLLQKLEDSWRMSDLIFSLISDEAWLKKAIELRHPFIFYLGHLAAFAWNQFRAVGKLCGLDYPAVHEEFDKLFERGIDPDVETLEVHDHSADMHKQDWPSVKEIRDYVAKAREAMRNAVEQLNAVQKPVITALKRSSSFGSTLSPSASPQRGKPMQAGAWLDPMAQGMRVVYEVLEHEMMHQETLLYMIQQLPVKFMDTVPSLKEKLNWDHIVASHVINNKYVSVPAGAIQLGTDLDAPDYAFGWDNEFPCTGDINVPAFKITKYPITNFEFLQFVKSGCYDMKELWTESDWAWKEKEGLRFPVFWKRARGNQSQSGFLYSTLIEEVPLEVVMALPVTVSQAEAAAYAKWKGARLPTEPEWMRAIYGQHGTFIPSPYPWGSQPPTPEHGNFGYNNWHCTAVDAYPAGQSYWGLADTLGNGWEWTSTKFDGHPGFTPYIKSYPGYSADFFDGKHFVMKGGSWTTHRQIARPPFRNWFQGHYPYVFSKFRIVEVADTESAPVATLEVKSPAAEVTPEKKSATDMVKVNQDEHDARTAFARHVLTGLSKSPRQLSSMYFYDDSGSAIFEKITELDEYYLTKCESSIFDKHKEVLSSMLSHAPFNLVELGCGDGRKTRVLLEHFLMSQLEFTYMPIDISDGAIKSLSRQMAKWFPTVICTQKDAKSSRTPEQDKYPQDLILQPVHANNAEGLKFITDTNSRPNFVMFIGSSIGNFDINSSVSFLQEVWQSLNNGDYLMVGFDLKKDPHLLQAAYDDSKDVTAEFNYNLLDRMNTELGANFQREKWMHRAVYNPRAGAMESWLVSKEAQIVDVKFLKKKFKFEAWEWIQTESSFKYSVTEIADIARRAGFEVVQNLFDDQKWFVDSVWRVVKDVE